LDGSSAAEPLIISRRAIYYGELTQTRENGLDEVDASVDRAIYPQDARSAGEY
jgi:hypothetical protein